MSLHAHSLLWRLLRTVLVFYAVIVGCVYFFQRKLEYFPDANRVPLPRGQEYLGLQAVELVTKDGVRLFSWYWPGKRPLTLVYFHGNGGNRRDRLDWVRDCHRLGYGVFILDYRGYGGSGGTPTEKGLYQDAQAALDWLRKETDQQLVYLGESLGSAVAVEMATRSTPAAVIIQSGFSSAVDVGKHRYPYLPVNLLMKDRFESLTKIKAVRCPLLVVHGEHDSTVPLSLGRALYEAAPEPKDWFLVPGAAHNDVVEVAGQAYWDRLEAFLQSATRREQVGGYRESGD